MNTESLVLRAFVVALCAACAVSSLGQTHRPQTQRICTQREAILADADIDNIQTWNDVYRSFKKFAHCDDASISEGYSDRIMRLLVHHWNAMPAELPRSAIADVSFRKFVIHHIDEMASQEELKAVQQNAQFRCPASSAPLCSEIDKRIKRVREIDASPSDN